MKKRVIVSTVLASLLLSTSALYANVSASISSKTEMKQEKAKRLKIVLNKVATQHRKGLQKAPKEMLNALQQSVVALGALQHNKVDEAKKALQKATKLFDVALKNNPKLDFIPVADDIRVNDFSGDSKLVQHIIDSAQKLLKDHDTQAAREILMPLQDEMDMTTTLLPLATYPAATHQALKELNKGQKKLAFTTLATALNSTIMETTMIPLPLITAQDLVLSASKLDKTKKKEANKLLDEAQDELQKAVFLGYTKKHTSEYKNLQNEIKNIQNEIHGKNRVEKLYSHVVKSFDSLIHKHEKESTKKATPKR